MHGGLFSILFLFLFLFIVDLVIPPNGVWCFGRLGYVTGLF